ncbi:hypothetical protein MRB53_023015 [Persea americana]|uniref:Uncharacterized protein n=1 Tax=Persea americana TaxID=3435 RepID=A0ACC2L8K6_PERAE|nr:hypothetical protein MRB53_023015 [Persea americana]
MHNLSNEELLKPKLSEEGMEEIPLKSNPKALFHGNSAGNTLQRRESYFSGGGSGDVLLSSAACVLNFNQRPVPSSDQRRRHVATAILRRLERQQQ